MRVRVRVMLSKSKGGEKVSVRELVRKEGEFGEMGERERVSIKERRG